MEQFLEIIKGTFSILTGLIALGAIAGAAYVTRYKVTHVMDDVGKIRDKLDKFEGRFEKCEVCQVDIKGKIENIQSALKYKVNESDLKVINEKITNTERTSRHMDEEFQKQKELFTEIRIEMGSVTAELKSMNQLLLELKNKKD